MGQKDNARTFAYIICIDHLQTVDSSCKYLLFQYIALPALGSKSTANYSSIISQFSLNNVKLLPRLLPLQDGGSAYPVTYVVNRVTEEMRHLSASQKALTATKTHALANA